MLWTSIGIEPAAVRASMPLRMLAGYTLSLPLLADGRIAFVQLRASSERAVVTRFAHAEDDLTGLIRFHGGQWNFVWDGSDNGPASPPWVRFSGNRFLDGDPVCLRQHGKPLAIYRVCPPHRARLRGKGP